MFRSTALGLTLAAALTACSTAKPELADKNPNATTVVVKPPIPVAPTAAPTASQPPRAKSDVMGRTLENTPSSEPNLE